MTTTAPQTEAEAEVAAGQAAADNRAKRLTDLESFTRRVETIVQRVRDTVTTARTLEQQEHSDRLVDESLDLADGIMKVLAEDIALQYADYTIPEVRVRIMPDGTFPATIYTAMVPYGEPFAEYEAKHPLRAAQAAAAAVTAGRAGGTLIRQAEQR